MNYLIELDDIELENIEGGIIPLIILGAAALLLTGCTQQNNNNQTGSSSVNIQCSDCTVNVSKSTNDTVSNSKK